MISHKLLGESFTGATAGAKPPPRARARRPKPTRARHEDDRTAMVVFCIQRLLIAGRHRLWLRLRRYLIVFDPLTFVLD